MCNKLLQPFACGHSKTICTTPCPHALNRIQQQQKQQQPHNSATYSSTGTSLARSDSTALGTSLTRSGSTASSVRSTTTTQNRSLRSRNYIERLKPRALQRQWSTISLKARSQARNQTYIQPQGPGFCFDAPAVAKRSVEAAGGSGGPGTPESVVSNADAAVEDWLLPTPSTTGSFPLQLDSPTQQHVPTQQYSSALPSPALPSPALPSSALPSPALPSPALPSPAQPSPTQQPPPAQPSPTPTTSTGSPTPPPSSQFCEYFFPQYLVASQYPCRECYGNAEWEGLRKKWVEVYRVGHPMDDLKGVERLSGVNLYIKSGDGGDAVDDSKAGEDRECER